MNPQLEQQLGENLHGLVASQPFEPDPAAIERRGRRYLRRRTALTRAGLGAGVAAAVALTVTVRRPPASRAARPRPGTRRPRPRPVSRGPRPRPVSRGLLLPPARRPR